MTARHPVPGRRQRKRQQTASHLADTAFAMFEEAGYEAVTMEQIAARADVAKATLYSYFPMKEALVAHRLKTEIAQGMAGLAPALARHRSFATRMHFLLRESAAWHASKRAYLPYYLRYLQDVAGAAPDVGTAPDDDNGARRTWDIMTAMFEQAQQAGEVTRSIPAQTLGWSLQFLLFGALTRWLRQPEEDLAKAFVQAFDLLMHGASPRERPENRQ